MPAQCAGHLAWQRTRGWLGVVIGIGVSGLLFVLVFVNPSSPANPFPDPSKPQALPTD